MLLSPTLVEKVAVTTDNLLSWTDVANAKARAETAIARADGAIRSAQQLLSESKRIHGDSRGDGAPRYFVLRGEVEGRPVRAMWFGGSLWASDALVERAQLLTAMGEQFEAPGVEPVPASLASLPQAMLTLIRASDHVGEVRLGPFGHPDRPQRMGGKLRE